MHSQLIPTMVDLILSLQRTKILEPICENLFYGEGKQYFQIIFNIFILVMGILLFG